MKKSPSDSSAKRDKSAFKTLQRTLEKRSNRKGIMKSDDGAATETEASEDHSETLKIQDFEVWEFGE